MAEVATNDPTFDLTISIATWNNRDLIAQCLRSLEAATADLSAEICVVENASTDGTAEMIRAQFPAVRLIENDRPKGFSANHNQVLRRAAGRFVLLLNDDTVVAKDAPARAVWFLDANSEAGAVGCTLVKPDGTPERISQRFPHPLDPLFPSLRNKVKESGDTPGVKPGGEAVEVDRLSGACLMVRREVLDQVGLLDERFDPCYGEDTDLCYRIKRAGWRIFRLPDARVIHYRGRTAQRELADPAYRLQQAKFLWYRKHRSRAALRLYRASVILASTTQLVLSLPLLLIPRRCVEARKRCRRLAARIRAAFGASRSKRRSPQE